MTKVDEFTSFYAATGADTLRVTYAVCGDRQVALEAVSEAYRHAWRDWAKIRDRDALAYVRTEAWRASGLIRGTHPLRRRHEDDADTELLDALHSLDSDARRLIVLMTLGDTDLEHACREIDITAEEGTELVGPAVEALESELDETLDSLEPRLRGLGKVTGQLELPPVAQVRQRADRGRKVNTLVLALLAVVAIVGAAVVSVDGGSLTARADVPRRERIGDERPDVVLEARKIDDSSLLTPAQISGLDPQSRWRVLGTDEDLAEKRPYATCQTRRYANTDPLSVYLRTYGSTGAGQPLAAQSIEVSRDDADAREAYERIVGWYADCEVPGIELRSSAVVSRPFGDFRLLTLRTTGEDPRTITVGFAQSGRVTTTLVHEVQSGDGPDAEAFAQVLNRSVAKVCRDSGGRCSDDISVETAPPPPTRENPDFLGTLDLPPVSGVDGFWVGVDPTEPAKGRNPSATLCDTSAFDADAVQRARSRVFVIPEAGLPEEFGLAETVGQFASASAAKRFMASVRDDIDDCEDDDLSAKVADETAIDGDGYQGRSYELQFELSEDSTVTYRTAFVRRGSHVAQVTFTPAGSADLSGDAFTRIASRAGERLFYASSDE